MRTKEKKGPVRNFTLEKAADRELVERSGDTGRTMTKILEDLLLGRRQLAGKVSAQDWTRAARSLD